MESNRVDSGARRDLTKTPDLDSTPGGFPISPVASVGSPPAQRTSHSSNLDLDAPVDPDSYYRSRSSDQAHAPTSTGSTNALPAHHSPPFVAGSHSPPKSLHPPASTSTSTSTTSTTSRLPRASNSTQSSLPKPTSATSGPYNFRAALRSTTNPASGAPSSGVSAKLRSVSANVPSKDASRSPNLSVVDRARQFEQNQNQNQNQNRSMPALASSAKIGGKATPTTAGQEQPVALIAARKAGRSQERQATGTSPTTTRKMTAKSSPDEAYNADASLTSPSRQPLFGEVITVTNGGVGHGIPTNFAKRSASESNMQSPTTSPLSTRSRSRMDAQFQKATTAGASKRSPSHGRTASDTGAVSSPGHQRQASSTDLSANAQLQSHRSPPTRQLVKPRRYSASSEGLSSTRPRRDSSVDRGQRPTTPQSATTSRRYVRSPDRPAAGGHTVNAVIKALPESTIPTPSLRSSRPRVPLSAASTASSRAKQSERSSSRLSDRGSPTDAPMSPAARERKPHSAGMLRAAEKVRQQSRSRSRRPNYAPTDSESSQEFGQVGDPIEETRPNDTERGDLKVDTAQAKPKMNDLDGAATDMETDDSPILGRTVYQPVGQRHDRNDEKVEKVEKVESATTETSEVPHTSSSLFPRRLSTIEASPDPNELIHANFDASPGAEQPPTPFEPPKEVIEAFSADGGAEGTIRVQLRGTPVIDAAAWPAATHTSAAAPFDGGMRDSGIGSTDVDQPSVHSKNVTPSKAAKAELRSPANHQPYDTPPEGDKFSPGSAKIIVGPEVPPKHSPLSPQLPDIPGIGTGLGLFNPPTPQLPTHPPPPVPSAAHLGLSPAVRGQVHASSATSVTDPQAEHPPAMGHVVSTISHGVYGYWKGVQPIPRSLPAIGLLEGGDDEEDDSIYTDARDSVEHNASNASIRHSQDHAADDVNLTPRATQQPLTSPYSNAGSSPASGRAAEIRQSESASRPSLQNASVDSITKKEIQRLLDPSGPQLRNSIGEPVQWQGEDLATFIAKYRAVALEDPEGYQKFIERAKRRDVELEQTGADPVQPTPEMLAELQQTAAADLKRIHKIRHIVRELAVTEEKWRNDLDTVDILYMRTAESVGLSRGEINTIFGSWESLVELAAKFKVPLQIATRPLYHRKDAEDQDCFPAGWEDLTLWDKSVREAQLSVGACFLEWTSQLADVFGHYIYNQTASAKRLEKVKENSKVADWLDFVAEHHKDLSGAWDLPSLLVKPLQRLTKYPLLLKSLLDEMNDDHPDYQNLAKAHAKLTEQIAEINKRKARMDLVDKVRNGEAFSSSKMKVEDKKTANALFSIPNLKVNIPGLKMFKRGERGERGEQKKDREINNKKWTDKERTRELRIRGKAQDNPYDKLEESFMTHFFQLQIVMADIADYTKRVKDSAEFFKNTAVNITELIDIGRINDNAEIAAKWVALARTAKDFATHGIEKHAHEVYRQIVAPLKELMALHSDPHGLIASRKQHYQYYIEYLRIQDEMRDDPKLSMPADLADAAARYEALTETLKEELPILYAHTDKLVGIAARGFMSTERDWYKLWIDKFTPLIELGVVNNVEDLLPRLQNHQILMSFRNDFGPAYAAAQELSICNGTLRQATSSHLSPEVDDGHGSHGRPSTQASRSETNLSSPGPSRRHSGQQFASPPPTSYPTPAEQYAAAPGRTRGNSYNTNLSPAFGPSSTRPSTGAASRPTSEDYRNHQAQYQQRRLFSSSMPMDDDEPSRPMGLDGAADDDDDEEVMFVAASLFDFNLDRTREEAGYPYLSYQPGEIFNVFGVRGELWLASNQDDKDGTVGWVWDKHFSKISNAVLQ